MSWRDWFVEETLIIYVLGEVLKLWHRTTSAGFTIICCETKAMNVTQTTQKSNYTLTFRMYSIIWKWCMCCNDLYRQFCLQPKSLTYIEFSPLCNLHVILTYILCLVYHRSILLWKKYPIWQMWVHFLLFEDCLNAFR